MKYLELANKAKYNMEQEFHSLNKEIFNGVLTLNFPLKWSSLKNSMGRVSYTYYRHTGEIIITKLTLSTFFDITEETLRNIMIHEMVHVYFLQSGSLENHGPKFMKMIRGINKQFSKYNVGKTEDVSDYEVEQTSAKGKKLNFIILHRRKNDPLLIGVYRALDNPGKSFEENFKKMYNMRRSSLYKVEYGSSSNIELQRFRVSRTLFSCLKAGQYAIIKDKLYSDLKPYIVGSVT